MENKKVIRYPVINKNYLEVSEIIKRNRIERERVIENWKKNVSRIMQKKEWDK